MVFNGAEFSNKDLFEEVKETALREGISTLAQFRDLIDELVEEKRIYGFFSDDEDLTQVKEGLQTRWREVERMMLNRVGRPVF